jgi:D-beta-D-heptose 7-phosphate kinase/D-beta-D-heptose 1-phosphate adenosyltransferase
MDPKKEILDRICKFPAAHVLVLGDLVLDVYLDCKAIGVASEAPVPLLEVYHESSFPGGAANVGLNLASLGVQTRLIGIVGKDAEAGTLAGFFRNVRVAYCPIVAFRPTTRKTRVLSQSHYYLRLDEEETSPITSAELDQFLESVRKALPETDLVVISDYDKGLFTAASVKPLEELFAGFKVRILADLKPQNLSHWQHLDLIAPNLSEARIMQSQLVGSDVSELSETQLAEGLSRRLDCDVVLKLGSEGMMVASKGRHVAHVKARSRTPRNVSGAGDTVLSTLAAVLACGGQLKEAVELAAMAASIAISHDETHAVSSEELIRAMGQSQEDLSC